MEENRKNYECVINNALTLTVHTNGSLWVNDLQIRPEWLTHLERCLALAKNYADTDD